jgi:hypothetical protein
MKVFQFCINTTHGRVHAPALEYVVPMLRQNGSLKPDDLLTIEGNVVCHKREHIICPYCQTANFITSEDLGFEEFECSYCECTFIVPDTFAELVEYNADSLASIHNTKPTHYRVMLKGEDGTLSCLKNGVPVEYIDLVVDGYQTHYTEGQVVFSEPEETLADLHRMCEIDDDY